MELARAWTLEGVVERGRHFARSYLPLGAVIQSASENDYVPSRQKSYTHSAQGIKKPLLMCFVYPMPQFKVNIGTVYIYLFYYDVI